MAQAIKEIIELVEITQNNKAGVRGLGLPIRYDKDRMKHFANALQELFNTNDSHQRSVEFMSKLRNCLLDFKLWLPQSEADAYFMGKWWLTFEP